MCIGNILEIENGSERLLRMIAMVSQHAMFEDALISEGIERCLPQLVDIAEGIRTTTSIADYAQGEARFGVVAITLREFATQRKQKMLLLAPSPVLLAFRNCARFLGWRTVRSRIGCKMA